MPVAQSAVHVADAVPLQDDRPTVIDGLEVSVDSLEVLGATPGRLRPGRLRADPARRGRAAARHRTGTGRLAGVSAGYASRAPLHDTTPLDALALAGAGVMLVGAAVLAT